MPPDITGAKRAGLPVDLDRLTAEGDDWLSGEERYALKAHGVCPQTQPGMFLLRVRTGDGVLPAAVARGLAAVADAHGRGWVHLTTRQQVELHHVEARSVTAAIAAVEAAGLSSRATCGHNVRGVMACPDAGPGLDEPFDCHPDARATTASIVDRSPDLPTRLPQRLNIAFGGCPACREHAKANEIGFVSVVGEGGALGYELWLGGSLGKSVPTLARRAVAFLPRADVLPAVHAIVDVFTTYGDLDKPGKARLKYLIRDLGWDDFLALVLERLEVRRSETWPEPEPVAAPDPAVAAEVLAVAPSGGWSTGVRPSRTPGRALVTVNVPLGDVDGDELRALADLAEDVADGCLVVTRNQNLVLRDVPVDAVPSLRARLAELALGVAGADQAVDVRACTGGPVCALAITPAQAAGAALVGHPALARNSALRVAVSGCVNACAQQQIADLGFSGGRVTVDGEPRLGYQVWVGGDLAVDRIGTVVGRVADSDVPAITGAIVGVWEALRHRGESLGDTVARLGLDAFRAHVEAVFTGRWAPGPEPEPESVVPTLGLVPA